jgi:hypothetical protein
MAWDTRTGTIDLAFPRTVHDLVGGSDIAFVDAGTRTPKGLEGEWQLFAVSDGQGSARRLSLNW